MRLLSHRPGFLTGILSNETKFVMFENMMTEPLELTAIF